MSSPAFDQTMLAQDIEATKQTIDSLEQHLTRLRELTPQNQTASASTWSAIATALGDFFETIRERIAPDDGADDAAGGNSSAVASSGSPPSFNTIMRSLSEQLWGGGDAGAGPKLEEAQAVIDGIDAELDRLRGDLRGMQDRLADADDLNRAVEAQRDADAAGTLAIDLDVLHADRARDRADNEEAPQVDLLDADVAIPVIPGVVAPTPDPHPIEPSFEPGKAVDIGELDGAVYDVSEILASGKTVADLRRYSVPPGALKAAGVSAADAMSGGYTVADLKEGEYAAHELHGLVLAGAMRDAGFRADEMHGIYDASECAGAFSVQELASAGFTVQELHGIVSLSDLHTVFPLHDLRNSFGAAELRDAGCSASDLAAAGFDWSELASAGFDFEQLTAAGAPEHALRIIFPDQFRGADTGDSTLSHAQSDDDDS